MEYSPDSAESNGFFKTLELSFLIDFDQLCQSISLQHGSIIGCSPNSAESDGFLRILKSPCLRDCVSPTISVTTLSIWCFQITIVWESVLRGGLYQTASSEYIAWVEHGTNGQISWNDLTGGRWPRTGTLARCTDGDAQGSDGKVVRNKIILFIVRWHWSAHTRRLSPCTCWCTY
jgi:hypothetical protein